MPNLALSYSTDTIHMLRLTTNADALALCFPLSDGQAQCIHITLCMPSAPATPAPINHDHQQATSHIQVVMCHARPHKCNYTPSPGPSSRCCCSTPLSCWQPENAPSLAAPAPHACATQTQAPQTAAWCCPAQPLQHRQPGPLQRAPAPHHSAPGTAPGRCHWHLKKQVRWREQANVSVSSIAST